jgi:hypothetical protein
MSAANGELARLRREDIRALHAEPRAMSYRAIGEALGIDWGHARQLAAGVVRGNSARAREARAIIAKARRMEPG